ncbi:MAG TPA: ParB/RepB/Spo0J family partition protein [Bacteroidetes bacterium]|nr:ParB/RepB/Spo0J family partition protein [Bacteroidota bacterium]
MADKRRLGRGLYALIPEYADDEERKNDQFAEIAIGNIAPNPFQPREDFDVAALNELKSSISEMGMIQPVTVRPVGDGYQLISGERRLRAVKELGYEIIPAYILHVESDDEMLEMALIENIQREDLNAIDVAKAYEKLISECDLTQEQVAQKVSKDRTTVTNFLRLLKLPLSIQDSLRKKALSMGHARALLGVDDAEVQKKIWKKIMKYNLSVRRVEQLAKEYSQAESPQKRGNVSRKSPQLIYVEDKFREIYGTQVRIYPKKEGGKIEIEYYSADDLDRIYNILTADTKNY